MLNPSLIPLALVWQPIASPLRIAAAAVVLMALAVFAYVRTSRGRAGASGVLLAMRVALIAAIAVVLMGPSSLPDEQKQSVRPKLRILLDTSESMLTKDCGAMSRFEFVQERVLNESRLRALARDFQIEIVGFDEKLRSLSAAALLGEARSLATGRSTHLSECVTTLLARIPSDEEGASLVVISDGRDTQSDPISPAAALARSRHVPIHAVAVGAQTLRSDLAVMAVPMQDYLLPGEPGAILVRVFQSGLENATTTLTVGHGTQRQKFPIRFEHRSSVEVQVPVQQAEPGQYEYQVSIDPVSGEAETDNNAQTVFCEVQKKRIRVLILEGQPFWDSKFLAQSLRKDEHIDVTQITQVSTAKRETIVTRAEEASPKVPSIAEEWAKYDVVILGQAVENVLTNDTTALLDNFVSDHGGHLIFARGMPYNRKTASGQKLAKQFANLEPVVWGNGQLERLSLTLTPTGRSSQWFSLAKTGIDADLALAQLPGFEKTNIVEREKPATIVLAQVSVGQPVANAGATSAGQPAIVRMTYGRGTVVGILGEGLWRWSLLPPDKQRFVAFYDTFWSNLVRWLAMGGEFSPDQQVALHLSRTTLRMGDPLVLDVVYKHAPPSGAHPKLELTEPARPRHEVALEPIASREPRFRATLKPETIGIHRVSVETPSMQPPRQEKRFNVYNTDLERLLTTADPMSLRMLAEHSGGQFYEANRAADLAEQLHRFRASQQVPPKLEYIWDRGLVLFVLLVWGGSEWLLRRAAGLL